MSSTKITKVLRRQRGVGGESAFWLVARKNRVRISLCAPAQDSSECGDHIPSHHEFGYLTASDVQQVQKDRVVRNWMPAEKGKQFPRADSNVSGSGQNCDRLRVGCPGESSNLLERSPLLHRLHCSIRYVELV